jgi:hypothetical protein
MTGRRALKFHSEDDVITYVQHVRTIPLARLGNWSLPQVSRHLAMTIEGSLTPPATEIPTEEQTATKNKFFSMILGPDGILPNMPLPSHLVPPPDSNDAEIVRFVEALGKLKTYPHRFISVGKCGPVPVEEVRLLHMRHAEHHLSFLVPASRRTGLKYANVDEVKTDVTHLRQGAARVGNWSLDQACWHLNFVMTYFMSPGPHPIPETSPGSRDTLNRILVSGQIPDGISAPERALPPADCGTGTVDTFLQTLEQFRTHKGPFAPHRLFGPLTLDEGRKLSLMHCTRHFSYLVPVSELTTTD